VAKYIAYVSVRASQVLSVEDLAVDNPEAHDQGVIMIGQQKPMKMTVGCLIQLKGASRSVACSMMREEVLKEVEENPDGFLTFQWVDPDMRTSA